jgi:hypothetical protein
MIVIKLWGGLGNQLFQYAFGRAIAKNNGVDVAFDTSFYDNQPSYVGRREIELLKLTRSIEITKPTGITKIFENRYVNKAIRIFPKVKLVYGKGGFIKETGHTFLPWVLDTDKYDGYYFDGYWQTEKYFLTEKPELMGLFANFKISEYGARIVTEEEKCNSISVHIRRGDYYTKSHRVGYKVRDDYYNEAFEYINKRIASPTFYIFSDDIEWIKSQDFIKQYDCRFVENKGPNAAIEDMICMSKCKHGIMSSSTFSWWGNWIRDDLSTIVIAPTGFYCNTDFIPDRWTRL